MRTTLDLDEKLLNTAMIETGLKTKTAVIEMGLRQLLEKAARDRLIALGGTDRRAQAPPRKRTRSQW
jgi:Arc/MetJ family transcription regulator